ncbi:MAG: hypothetical protein K2Q26_02700 [Bdellovibrionales bacterium]|nr:hypothetical protein [Bdellovibrionales bacterium]
MIFTFVLRIHLDVSRDVGIMNPMCKRLKIPRLVALSMPPALIDNSARLFEPAAFIQQHIDNRICNYTFGLTSDQVTRAISRFKSERNWTASV